MLLNVWMYTMGGIHILETMVGQVLYNMVPVFRVTRSLLEETTISIPGGKNLERIEILKVESGSTRSAESTWNVLNFSMKAIADIIWEYEIN